MSTRADRRAFLERSLADLEEEHDAGDLTDGDYADLKADYERRLAVLDGRAKPSTAGRPPPRSWAARLAIGAGVTAFAVLAGVLMAQAMGRRSPDGTITGADVGGGGAAAAGSTTTLPAALSRCLDLPSNEALECYIAYTRANPDDAAGFVHFGLFSVNQGLQSGNDDLLAGGETFLRRALAIDPDRLDARVNLALLLERTGRDDEARAELDELEGVELPVDLQGLVDFVERNLAAGDDG